MERLIVEGKALEEGNIAITFSLKKENIEGQIGISPLLVLLQYETQTFT